MNSPVEEPRAQSLSEVTRRSGIAALFSAGLTGDGHHWELRSAAGELLAVTARVHKGGRGARAFRKVLTLTGFDAGNDIHAELRGDRGRVLARISSTNAAPAIVTVLDDAGALVAKSIRDKTLLLKVKHPDKFVVVDADDRVVVGVDCESDPPWQVLDGDGALIVVQANRTTRHQLSAALVARLTPTPRRTKRRSPSPSGRQPAVIEADDLPTERSSWTGSAVHRRRIGASSSASGMSPVRAS